MKTSLICLLVSLSVSLCANDNRPQLLIDQLTDLNKYWHANADVLAPGIRSVNLSEKTLIQLHLQLVENTLRSRDVCHLNLGQRVNRTSALDILHDYWQEGVFPQNIFHEKRTPYFIDHLNTACAVGYLVIQTGHVELVNQIAAENNYAYIDDMDYPMLVQWADEYGFTLEELKWIQPAYEKNCSDCDPDTVHHVTCYGGHDGCIGLETADFSGFDPGKVFIYDRVWQYHETSGIWFEPHPSYKWPCELTAGYFKLVFKDQFNESYEFFYDIFQPDPISVNYTVTPGNEHCSESVEVVVTGGVAPYHYLWPTGDTTSIVTDLCPGVYALTIVDANGCIKWENVYVSFETSAEDLKRDRVRLFPNPAIDVLHVELSPDYVGESSFSILNAHGVKVDTGVGATQTGQVDISYLPSGVYFLLVSQDEGDVLKTFVKE